MPTGYLSSTELGPQSYDHMAVVVSGLVLNYGLEFAGKLASGETCLAGGVVSLNSSGEFVSGLSALTAMPMITHASSTDSDVATHFGSNLDGTIAAYPVTGGYEFSTTEFVAGTYAPNDVLEAAAGGNKGKVVKTTLAGAAIPLASSTLGIVSRPVSSTQYGTSVLHFWGALQIARA